MEETENSIDVEHEESTRNKIGRIAGGLGKKTVDLAKKAGSKSVDAAAVVGKKSSEVASVAKKEIVKSKDAVMEKLDVNGDGNVISKTL